MADKRKVLITGAAGRIGSFLTACMIDQYDLVLTDKKPPTDGTTPNVIPAEITDFEAVQWLCQGVDTVVHLAADPARSAPWESLLSNNVIGAYHVFEAAAQAHCHRVIFASSINVVDGYPPDVQVRTDMPVRPPNLYGATKAWGETLARYYADKRHLSAICLRFGAVMTRERVARIQQSTHEERNFVGKIVTFADAAKLILASIEAPAHVHFGIFHGVSDNYWKRLDMSDTRERLHYTPEDDAFVLTGDIQKQELQ